MTPSSQLDHLLDARSRYRILIRGKLDAGWSNRLGGMTISAAHLADGALATTLTGVLPDQSALVGVLNTLHDLGWLLMSVERAADAEDSQ